MKNTVYAVRLTPEQLQSLSAFRFTFLPPDTFKKAEMIDTDALQTVCEIAEEEKDRRGHVWEALDDLYNVRRLCQGLEDIPE